MQAVRFISLDGMVETSSDLDPDNLLSNPGFEVGLVDWLAERGASISGDGHRGSNSVQTGTFVIQSVTAVPNHAITLPTFPTG